MKKNILVLFTLFLFIFTLCGCGKNKELIEYEENMATFIDEVSNIKIRMEEVDIDAENANEKILNLLDEMQLQFARLANMDVPKEFASIESLADEADEYMTEAVTIYHQVFEADEFDAANADVASQNYDRAMKRLSYISTLLQGELPDDENLIITEEEALDFEPVTEE